MADTTILSPQARHTELEVSLSITVTDPEAFAAEARRIAVEGGLEGACVDVYSADNLTDCARMIFDPGVSPPGCQIHDSSAE